MNTFGLPESPLYERSVFIGNSSAAGVAWQPWAKPKGKSMCSIFLVGGGGPGGTGRVSAVLDAPGGGGGGSGGQTNLVIPLAFLPPIIYISGGAAKGSSTGLSTYVSLLQDNAAGNLLAIANGGGAGVNASAGSAGTGGLAGSIATVATMPLGWAFATLALAGQAGQAGSTSSTGNDLTLPATGLRVTGGTGGGGLGNTGTSGNRGGNITALAAPTPFIGQSGGSGPAAGTDPAGNGSPGYNVSGAGLFYYGGTGGSSTHGSASGAGLQQSSGGDGAPGCGGGACGGALTASATGSVGKGGPGLVIITCW